MNYALIVNGEVVNIIWLKPDNAGDFPGAVACGGKPVAIGDSYSDGKFWRDGAEVMDETGARLAELEAQIATCDAALVELAGMQDTALTCIDEQNAAIVEIAELIDGLMPEGSEM